MNATIQNGQVTYVGFNPNDNNKWLIETRGSYTYVNYQKDEFTQVIFGYVIKELQRCSNRINTSLWL